MAHDQSVPESSALRTIIGGSTTETFFCDVWQNECRVFRGGAPLTNGNENNDVWEDQRVQQSPFEETIRNAWHVLVGLLQNARTRESEGENKETLEPLVFRQQESLSTGEIMKIYGGNLFAAYLDGCSVVLNHADWICPYIASLCLDLQKQFPHAYANAYLTPPDSKAVNAHADDRDVLVIQIFGKKHWKVYQNVPIPYPYPDEQVGKAGLDIPAPILQGPTAIDTVISTGDVIYVPRGFVHEARTAATQPSFHVTIALATHDWTLAGTLSSMTNQILKQVVDFRKAMPLSLPMSPDLASVPDADKELLQRQLEKAFELLRQNISAESIQQSMQKRLERHNQRALIQRQACKLRAQFSNDDLMNQGKKPVVGFEAAKYVKWKSTIRASTLEEKASLPPSSQPRGLHVREATADALLGLLQHLKANNGLECRVCDLLSLTEHQENASWSESVCELTLFSFARCCVELGAMAVVHGNV